MRDMKERLPLPRGFLLEQRFERPTVADIPATVRSEPAGLHLPDQVRPGQTVAIGAGSRGIRGIAEILEAIVDEIKALGASPFIVPAMGSHGGGTAEGQRELLASCGVSEAYRTRLETGHDLSVLRGPLEIEFDGDGNLISPLD
jgi:hypothetical protein